MLTVTYDHNSRTITMDQDGRQTEISTQRAKELWLSCTIDDHNVAFHRLAMCDFDMEEVEKQYAGLQGEGS